MIQRLSLKEQSSRKKGLFKKIKLPSIMQHTNCNYT